MAFFNDIGKKIAGLGQTVNNAPATPEARLNALISAEENKLNTIYCSMGKLYAANCKEPEGDFVPLFEAEKASLAAIENAKKELEALKATRSCPNCGKAVAADAKFCIACGTSLANSATAQPSNICGVCGNRVQAGMKFCTVCGGVVTPTAPVMPVAPAVPVAPAAPMADAPVAPAVLTGEKCPNCGQAADEGVKFCTSCGTPLTGSVPKAEPVPEIPVVEVKPEPIPEIPAVEEVEPEPIQEAVEEPTVDAADGRQCPRCGADVANDVLFCTNCGNPLMAPETQEIEPEPEEEETQTCSKCGMSVDAGMKFCPYCGGTMGEDEVKTPIDVSSFENPPHHIPLNPITDTRAFAIQHPITPAKKCCPTCGAATEADDVFCILCGTRL